MLLFKNHRELVCVISKKRALRSQVFQRSSRFSYNYDRRDCQDFGKKNKLKKTSTGPAPDIRLLLVNLNNVATAKKTPATSCFVLSPDSKGDNAMFGFL